MHGRGISCSVGRTGAVVKILVEMNETISQETISTELNSLLKLKIDKPYVT